MGLEYLRRRRIDNLSGQPVQRLSTVSRFPRRLTCFSAVSLQAKPIYGGWLLLAPEGTDFDNPVHRSRVSEAETPSPRDVGGGGGRSGEGLSPSTEEAAAAAVPQAPPCTHPLLQTGKMGGGSWSGAGLPSLGCKVCCAGQQAGVLRVLARLGPCSFIACCCCFLIP